MPYRDIRNPENFGLSLAGRGGDGNRQIKGTKYNALDFTVNEWDAGDTLPAYIPEWAMAQVHLWRAGMLPHGREWDDYVDFYNNHDGGDELIESVLPIGTGTDMIDDSYRVYKAFLAFGHELNNRVTGHYYRPGLSGFQFSSYIAITTFLITPKQALAIDQKYDDGNALTGRVMAAPWIGSGCTDDIVGTSANCNGIGGNIGDGSNTVRCLATATQNYDTDYDANTCALRVKASF